MNSTQRTTRGDQLRGTALHKLRQARALIDSAREDLCNLEGPGYCKSYQALLTPNEELDRITARIKTLAPPTGVFLV